MFNKQNPFDQLVLPTIQLLQLWKPDCSCGASDVFCEPDVGVFCELGVDVDVVCEPDVNAFCEPDVDVFCESDLAGEFPLPLPLGGSSSILIFSPEQLQQKPSHVPINCKNVLKLTLPCDCFHPCRLFYSRSA